MASNPKKKTINLSRTAKFTYDDWLEFFRKIPKATLEENIEILGRKLPGDGYAAAMRWLEIYENPSKMDKLYKGKLDKQNEEDIMKVAVGDDDEAFYEALIQQNVKQLESSSVSQQEVARLTSNINIFRKELRSIRSRTIRKDTVLARIMDAANEVKVAPKATKKAKTKPKPKPKRKVVRKKTDAKETKTRQSDTKD